jgi:hypothetical protein
MEFRESAMEVVDKDVSFVRLVLQESCCVNNPWLGTSPSWAYLG